MWCELRAFPLAGGTCGTRETRVTFSSFEMPWQESASIVSNTWLSALALHIVMWAVRFSANGSATQGINPCLAHCQFQESIVPRVSRVAHVPLAACKSRSSAPCHWLFMQLSKREAPLTPRCTRLGVQSLAFSPCLALSQLSAQSESSRLSLHIRRAERGSKAR